MKSVRLFLVTTALLLSVSLFSAAFAQPASKAGVMQLTKTETAVRISLT
ncbi:MAG: hypothetical protein WB661_05755 [Candidatus Bathyarchaeia archaeon]